MIYFYSFLSNSYSHTVNDGVDILSSRVTVLERQPRSQALSLFLPYRRERGSRMVTCLDEKAVPGKGSLSLNLLSLSVFVTVKTRLLPSSIWSSQSAKFYSSLHYAIVKSNYWNIILKPKQVKCLKAIYV